LDFVLVAAKKGRAQNSIQALEIKRILSPKHSDGSFIIEIPEMFIEKKSYSIEG
jgi:hypothetical protein